MPRKFILADAPHRSIDLSAGERIKDRTSLSANVGNAWAVAVWSKPTGSFSSGPGRTLFSIEHELTNGFPSAFPFSNLRIEFDGFLNSLVVRTWAGLAAPLKYYIWWNWFTSDTWIHTAVTWDGTNLLGYRDGIEVVPTSKVTDAAGSMGTPPARRIGVGTLGDISADATDFSGRIFSCGLWSIAVDASGIKTLWNGGYGAKIDPRFNQGGYTAAAFLAHYWRPGHFWPPFRGIGEDYGLIPTNRRNIMTNAVDVDETDIVHDWPGKDL